jgi:hypothetical protein
MFGSAICRKPTSVCCSGEYSLAIKKLLVINVIDREHSTGRVKAVSEGRKKSSAAPAYFEVPYRAIGYACWSISCLRSSPSTQLTALCRVFFFLVLSTLALF